MNGNYTVKFILHSFTNGYFLCLFKKKKQLKDKVITYEFSKDEFDEFQNSLPKKLLVMDEAGKVVSKYTLNLLKGENTYHYFSSKNKKSHELIFYKEQNLRIIVNGEEINEYDSYGNFKRVSFINLDNNEIKINETQIDLFSVLGLNQNKYQSYQHSFYDINKKYIVSRRIKTIQNMNFSKFYEKYIDNLSKFDTNLSELNKDVNYYNSNDFKVYSYYKQTFTDIEKELNLNLPKNVLEKTMTADDISVDYLNFFYKYVKMRIYFSFYYTEDKSYDNFVKIINYLNVIYNKLKKDDDYSIFEKSSILMSFAELFSIQKSCELILRSNFSYIKVDKAKNNSIIYLSMKFLNEFINNLDEDSPSYFKLIELNSSHGYYLNEKTFSYDIINLSDLKKHLKETLPSVISLYRLEEVDDNGFTENSIRSVGINESKLLKGYENINLYDNYFEEREIDVKNIAMKLSKTMMHECFGHVKFQFHSSFCKRKISDTPKKCFDNKIYKKLVQINKINKKNCINILNDYNDSDSGSYFESSFGKLPEAELYTSTLLSNVDRIGKLLEHPELFYKKEKIGKLQKYAFLKYTYKIVKEEEEAEGIPMNNEKTEKEIYSDEELEKMSIDEEIEKLSNYLLKFSSKNSKKEEKEESEIVPESETEKVKLFLKKKRNRHKKCDSPKRIKEKKIPSARILFPKITSRNKLIKKLSTENMPFVKHTYYFKLFLKSRTKI